MLLALQSLSSWITKYIGLIIIVFTLLACIHPQWFAWTVPYTAVFLGLAMFGMGLSIDVKDFQVVFTHPKELMIGAILQYSIMPILAYLLCHGLALPADIALGVILVGCCPGGTASNVITYIAKGDVALSVGMTIVSTLLAPLVTPILVLYLGGAYVDIAFFPMMLSIVKIVLIPVLVGLIIHHYGGKHVASAVTCMPLLSSLAIILIIAGIIAVNVDKIFTAGLVVLGVVILHNIFGLVLGWFVSYKLGLSYKKMTAIAIEVAMQNSGLAVSLSTLHFALNPLATLPGAIFSVWHNISGSLFATFRQRRSD